LDKDKKKFVARQDLDNFGGFLRNLLMHGVVGTALGGVSTQVGEPQNLIIAKKMGWDFIEFYLKMAHISIPILISGLIVTVLVERFKIVGYGYSLPDNVRAILKQNADKMRAEMDTRKRWNLVVQGIGGIWLVVALAMHLAEVGLIGLSVVIFLTAATGKTDENTIGHAFEEATPFTALLVVFFVIVGMIEETHLFEPIINLALEAKGSQQTYIFFFASGILSAISDNVFVGTIYIKEATNAFFTPELLGMTKAAIADAIKNKETQTLLDALAKTSPEEFKQLTNVAAAINVGTNIPSIATPNGQAAFLFLLTNAIAARINLSYIRMVKMAFPYFVVITSVAAAFLMFKWLI
jgi:NhaB family Na+:H+ antiporter